MTRKLPVVVRWDTDWVSWLVSIGGREPVWYFSSKRVANAAGRKVAGDERRPLVIY